MSANHTLKKQHGQQNPEFFNNPLMWKYSEENGQVVYLFNDGLDWLPYYDGYNVPDVVIQHFKRLRKIKEPDQPLFKVRTANAYLEEARNRPIPNQLFDKLWHENEFCICFADTNVGKSIKAVQIGDSIARGSPIHGFQMSAKAQKVLYFDFELSDKQFQNRYSLNYLINYVFSDNFYRVEINPDSSLPDNFKTFEEFLYHSLEITIQETEAKVLIIDNITYLKTDTERARDALPLMKYLKNLKSKFGLSILALAHTPKRNSALPITVNDLQGSKMLSNFCDSIFAIGKSSKGENIRYIKQIKERATEKVYGENNVIICEIVKPNNFLHFRFLEFGEEREHLRQLSDGEKDSRDVEALAMLREGKSNVGIAKYFGVSETAVRKWKKNYQKAGYLDEVEPIEPAEPAEPSSSSSIGTISPDEDIRSIPLSLNYSTISGNLENFTDEELHELFNGGNKVHRSIAIRYLIDRRIITGTPASEIINNSIRDGRIKSGENGYLYPT